MPSRVIAVWLDGFDITLADSYSLPVLTRLQSEGLVATLDNGTAHLTGLTGEHLATGLDPQAADRASAVRFDPTTYECVQEGARFAPVFGDVPTVVFDMSYFDLDKAKSAVVGITDWGVHDPGGVPRSRPESLRAEIEERFGAYPASRWIYATPWSSSAMCEQMGEEVSAAVDVRGRIIAWLLGERFTDWRLALIGFAEAHGVSEGMLHGSDPSHPWHGVESSAAAGQAVRSVYEAVDRAVGEIVDTFPNDTVAVFSMHGMGPNNSDVTSMALIGELMARWCGATGVTQTSFQINESGIPLLAENESWHAAVTQMFAGTVSSRLKAKAIRLKGILPTFLQRPIERIRKATINRSSPSGPPLAWMPLMRFQRQWPSMRAFAIPSYYDGRIRVNLKGRERSGIIVLDEYDAVLDEIEVVLRACTEPRTGQPVVERVERFTGDPLQLRDDDVDLVVIWKPNVLGLAHPDLGVIGPLPPRRTGGHVSPIGRCVIVGPDIEPGSLGERSSFDVVPTIMKLTGLSDVSSLTGRPMLDVS